MSNIEYAQNLKSKLNLDFLGDVSNDYGTSDAIIDVLELNNKVLKSIKEKLEFLGWTCKESYEGGLLNDNCYTYINKNDHFVVSLIVNDSCNYAYIRVCDADTCDWDDLTYLFKDNSAVSNDNLETKTNESFSYSSSEYNLTTIEDIIEGLPGNVSEDSLDLQLRQFQYIANKLKVKDMQHISVIITTSEYDPQWYDLSRENLQRYNFQIFSFNDPRKVTDETKNIGIREELHNGNIFLYFVNDEIAKSYIDYIDFLNNSDNSDNVLSEDFDQPIESNQLISNGVLIGQFIKPNLIQTSEQDRTAYRVDYTTDIEWLKNKAKENRLSATDIQYVGKCVFIEF